jgi:hypothetical protein
VAAPSFFFVQYRIQDHESLLFEGAPKTINHFKKVFIEGMFPFTGKGFIRAIK